MKQIFPIFAVITLLLAGCSFEGNSNIQGYKWSEASTHCEENGGILEIIPDSGGERGKCNFDDGSFCEEWAYFHGQCSPNRGNGNTVELQDIQEAENDKNISQETREEISELIEEIQEHEEEINNADSIVVCTADVKKCDDGSYVSRGGENCEFALCPGYFLDEEYIQEKVKDYESSGSELNESDIDLMNEIIDIVTKN